MHQGIVRATVHNSALFQHNDLIGLLNRCQAMRNHKHRSISHRPLESQLNSSFRFSIQSACGFIQQQ